MLTFNKTLASNVLMNANYFSPAQQLTNIAMYCITAKVTGTPAGTISLQACNDSITPVNWVTVANSSFVLSASGETMWNVSEVAYEFVRVAYVDASGGSSTATMNIIANGKGI